MSLNDFRGAAYAFRELAKAVCITSPAGDGTALRRDGVPSTAGDVRSGPEAGSLGAPLDRVARFAHRLAQDRARRAV